MQQTVQLKNNGKERGGSANFTWITKYDRGAAINSPAFCLFSIFFFCYTMDSPLKPMIMMIYLSESKIHINFRIEQINYARKLHEVHSSLHTIAAQFFFPFMNFNTIIYNKFRPPSYFPCGSTFISMDMVDRTFFHSLPYGRPFCTSCRFDKCTREWPKQS